MAESVETEQMAMDFYLRRKAEEPRVTLVCGGRDFRDRDLLFRTLDSLNISCVVHGGADGADRLGGEWAIARKVPEVIVPAQWDNHGRAAGTLRNGWMLKFTKIEHVVAFPGGRGTLNMIQQTEKAGILLTVISYG